MERFPIFESCEFSDEQRAEMDRVGHFVLPGLLTPKACERLTKSLSYIQSTVPNANKGHEPNRFAAEYDEFLESLIGHPQILTLARQVLGGDIRYDHCVMLNRPGGNQGSGWHSHTYSDDDPSLGFIRIFFYVNGFDVDDGGLKAVPGSHLYRDKFRFRTEEEFQSGWMTDKKHMLTGEPLEIEDLSVPDGTVVLMWTHAAHAVSPRQPNSDTRWTVVYAYRNPGRASTARWISEGFERKPIDGAEGLMSLY